MRPPSADALGSECAKTLEQLLAFSTGPLCEVLASRADQVSGSHRFPHENISTLARAGVLGATVPKEFGGADCGVLDLLPIVDRIGRVCLTTATVVLLHYCGTAIIADNGNPWLKACILPAIARGKHLTTLALAEPKGEEHTSCSTSESATNGGSIRLRGSKLAVMAAGTADSYIVSIGNVRSSHMDLFFVDKEAEGLEFAGGLNRLRSASDSSVPLYLNEVEVDEILRLGDVGAGSRIMNETVLPYLRIGLTSIHLALAEDALQECIGHETSLDLHDVNPDSSIESMLRRCHCSLANPAWTSEGFCNPGE
jgi:isovaleryl-CoA dehydrogenase